MYVQYVRTSKPLSIDVLVATGVNLLKLQLDLVESAGLEAADLDLDDREHASPVLGDDHLVGEPLKLAPQDVVLQHDLDLGVCRRRAGPGLVTGTSLVHLHHFGLNRGTEMWNT